MSDLISCPKCERKLRLGDDLLGKAVQCPACGLRFTSPTTPPTAIAAFPDAVTVEPSEMQVVEPAVTFADEPVEERYADPAEQKAWKQVRTGFSLILAAIFVLIGLVLIAAFGTTLMAGAARAAVRNGEQPQAVKDAAASLTGLLILIAGGGIVAQLLWVSGHGLCMGVPQRTGARGPAVAAFVLAVGATAFHLLGLFSKLAVGGDVNKAQRFLLATDSDSAFDLLVVAASLAALAAFLAFLYLTLRALGQQGMARSVVYLMACGAVATVLTITMAVIVGIEADQDRGVAGQRGGATALTGLGLGLGCIGIILALAWIIWFIVTLFLVRAEVVRVVHAMAWSGPPVRRFSR
jgi:hypothetical protein